MSPRKITGFLSHAFRSVSLPSTDSRHSLPDKGIVADTTYVLDVSFSMAEDDFKPTRLAAAQDAAMAFLRRRIETGIAGRVGLAAFAGIGFPVCPLTPLVQVRQIEDAIRSLKTHSDTNVAAGLVTAEHLFNQAQGRANRREIVLLSDGWNQIGEDPRVAADRLKKAGCEIDTVGIGVSPEMVDEELLRAIASLDANGKPRYRFIGDRDGLIRHFSEIGGLTR
jgi:Mg-chelatase subunit ChlD